MTLSQLHGRSPALRCSNVVSPSLMQSITRRRRQACLAAGCQPNLISNLCHPIFELQSLTLTLCSPTSLEPDQLLQLHLLVYLNKSTSLFANPIFKLQHPIFDVTSLTSHISPSPFDFLPAGSPPQTNFCNFTYLTTSRSLPPSLPPHLQHPIFDNPSLTSHL